MSDPLNDALAERNRILEALDVDAAKAFIAQHGGSVPSRKMDWLRVLHLARFEVTNLPPDLVTESQIYLARTGAQSVATLPAASPYLKAAMDLIFPSALVKVVLDDAQQPHEDTHMDQHFTKGDRVRINAVCFRPDEAGTVTAVHDRPRKYKVAVEIDGDPGPYLFAQDKLTKMEEEVAA